MKPFKLRDFLKAFLFALILMVLLRKKEEELITWCALAFIFNTILWRGNGSDY